MSARDQALTPLSIDIENVICDMNRLFNPLHNDFMLDYQIQAARDGYVLLTIALPEGMTKVFASMLQSMSGFFHFMHMRTKSVKASSKVHDPEEILKREQRKADFQEEVCLLFDGFINQGHSIKESVSLTNSFLRQKEHPWASYDHITRVVRSTGRFRKDFKLKADSVPILSTSPRADPRAPDGRRTSRVGVPVGLVVNMKGGDGK